MAKRKAARTTARKSAKKASATRKGGRKAAARKGAARKATARAARKATARKAAARKGAGRKTAKKAAKAARKAARPRQTAKTAVKVAARKSSRPAARRAAPAAAPRKAPALDRPRRTIVDTDDLVPTPPSSLDLDRSASAVRTGRREMRERYAEHTETSPALTAGDVDADWESAYSVGDEAPGGDNPTPDQDIVEDIGRAVGVEYEDNEELKGDEKIAKRDRKRWELDPASSEDYPDRD